MLQGVDVNAEAMDGATAIFEAAKGGSVKCLLELRKHGADPFHGVSYGATPLHIAAFHGTRIVLPGHPGHFLHLWRGVAGALAGCHEAHAALPAAAM